MATKLTGKKPLRVNKKSHANNKTISRQKPNLQKKKINGETIITSVREARTLNK